MAVIKDGWWEDRHLDEFLEHFDRSRSEDLANFQFEREFVLPGRQMGKSLFQEGFLAYKDAAIAREDEERKFQKLALDVVVENEAKELEQRADWGLF